MKKIIFLMIFLFFICGCSNKKILQINKNSILNIEYDNNKLVNNDFDYILEKINQKEYLNLYNLDIHGIPLVIDTKEQTYIFEVINNFIIYKNGDEQFYLKIKDINKELEDIIKKYTNEDFFTIEYISDYNTKDSDYLIKLDDANSFIVIKLTNNIYDFKVFDNTVAAIENRIQKIESNKTICIQTGDIHNININFINPYEYEFNITYDKSFITQIKKR